MTAEHDLGSSSEATALAVVSDSGSKQSADRPSADAGEIPASQSTEKRQPASSTDRSRAHRERKRGAGGELLSFVLGPSATAALAILRAKGSSGRARSKSKTVEATLIAQALASVDSAKAARALASKGLIDEATLNAWIAVLDASNSIAQPDQASGHGTSLGESPLPGR